MARKPGKSISFPMHLSDEVERLFDEIIHRPWGFAREVRGWIPSVDLFETEDSFILEADLPGVKSEDVKVGVENGDLVLEGQRTIEKSQSHGHFHTMERASGYFTRQIRLPESVKTDAIKAEFNDGVLRVTVPKSNPKKD
jgi:HSP20 family protein